MKDDWPLRGLPDPEVVIAAELTNTSAEESSMHSDASHDQPDQSLNEIRLQSLLAALGPAPADDDIDAYLAMATKESTGLTPIWDDADLDAAINDAADRLAEIHGGEESTGRHRRIPQGVVELAAELRDLDPEAQAVIGRFTGRGTADQQ